MNNTPQSKGLKTLSRERYEAEQRAKKAEQLAARMRAMLKPLSRERYEAEQLAERMRAMLKPLSRERYEAEQRAKKAEQLAARMRAMRVMSRRVSA